MLDETSLADYPKLVAGQAYTMVPTTRLVVAGADRSTFLHNFCTVDVKAMPVGTSAEGFILNTKGKLLGHLHFLVEDDQVVLLTIPDQFEVLHEHLDKYIFREDVTITDESEQWCSIFIAGEKASDNISQIFETEGEPLAKSSHSRFSIAVADQPIEGVVSHLELAGWGFLVSVLKSESSLLEQALQSRGLSKASASSLEIVRIENRTPRFHVDSSEQNLPQELDRDEKTISFTKGCYLGQETVARLDSLGRVNKVFRGFKFDGQVAPGGELNVDGKPAGRITSVCWSPKYESWIGLGFAKRNYDKPGQRFEYLGATATIN